METVSDHKIEVRIRSEAIFNSAEKEDNTVQNKVLSDGFGFVYFHAKSFKGQLKNQAMWLWKQYNAMDQVIARSFFRSIVKLFGINQEEEKCCLGTTGIVGSEQGIMKLSNLCLDARIRDWFLQMYDEDISKGYFRLSPQDLIEAQTHIRTSIQLDEGVVQDKMMTTFHTVKEGLAFYSTLYFDEDRSDYLGDVYRIVHSIRRIGAGIHRGRGLVEARLLINGHNHYEDYLNRRG